MIKRVVLPKEHGDTIPVNDLDTHTPVFAKYNGVICGMIVKEEKGWILRTGGGLGVYGHLSTLRVCINRGIVGFGYEFFVDLEE